MHNIDSLLLVSGINYLVERNNEEQHTQRGMINREQSSGKRYIGFTPSAPINIGDWLVAPSGDRYYVYDKETHSPFGTPYQLKCFICTEAEQNTQPALSNITFNIENASGSVIGTQSNFTFTYESNIQHLRDQVANSGSPDKAELEQMLSLLEMVVNDQVPPQKGLFSKFTSVLERNGWFTPQIASALLNWLTTQV